MFLTISVARNSQYSRPAYLSVDNVSKSFGKGNVSKQSEGVYRRSSFIEDEKNRAQNSWTRDCRAQNATDEDMQKTTSESAKTIPLGRNANAPCCPTRET